ncbi:MAG: EAL domain-containing protein [Actinomycetota bacterium]
MAGDVGNIPRAQRHLNFQVIVAIEAGEPFGAEAFLRWNDDQGDMVPTLAWLPDAAASGALTRYAIEAEPAWRSAAERFDGLVFSFNTTGHDLLDEDWMATTITTARNSSAKLALEVAHIQFDAQFTDEAGLAWDVPTIGDLDERLTTLRQAGLEIWLDDYGDTFRDEAIFDHAEIDVVKLDQTFLSLSTDALADVADRARASEKRLIIEGIETEAQRRHAFDAGIELGQGFLFGWPMPIGEFSDSIDR